MIYDNIITNIDSPLFHTAEYHNGDVDMYTHDNRRYQMNNVSESDFNSLYKNPNHEMCCILLKKYNFQVYGR